jgi:hypothetical protein
MVDRHLERLIQNRIDGFLIDDLPIIQWEAPREALFHVLDRLTLSTDLYRGVDYREAAGCRGNFESLENSWRPYFTSFTGVKRAPADRDVAYLVANNLNVPDSNAAVGATQYRDAPAVSLREDEPGVALAASLLLGANYNLSGRETTHSLAISKKEHGHQNVNGQLVPYTRYETPSISFVHYPRHRRFPKGVVVAHNKRDRRDPNNLHGAGLYV